MDENDLSGYSKEDCNRYEFWLRTGLLSAWAAVIDARAQALPATHVDDFTGSRA